MSKILLIDEDSNFLDSAKNYLEDKNENLENKTISSSEEAYELVKNNSYDCIVGDYQTIEDNDLELLEKVKKDLGSELPFIILTSPKKEKISIKALNIGADRCIQKPSGNKESFSSLAEAITQEVKDYKGKNKLEKIGEVKSTILDDAQEMIALHDTDHNINWANKAYAETMGTSKKDIIGKKCYEVWLGKDEPCKTCPVQKAMDKGEPREGEMNEPKKERIYGEDEKGNFYVSGSPVKDKKGNVLGAIEVAMDISKKERDKERKEFLYSLLRHDVQNKNQVVKGYLELLKEENLGEEIEQKIEKALNAVSASEKLINDVKTLLNIGRIELKERKINEILLNALNEVKDLAQRKDFDINTNHKETKIVVCDLCEKLFTNIIENSIRHSNGNKIEIDVKDKNNHVVVSIEDDGKGIPDDKKDKIFEKNYTTGGTGLGLYIVKEILNNSDGEIEVKDSDLGGARFEVYLPKPE